MVAERQLVQVSPYHRLLAYPIPWPSACGVLISHLWICIPTGDPVFPGCTGGAHDQQAALVPVQQLAAQALAAVAQLSLHVSRSRDQVLAEND